MTIEGVVIPINANPMITTIEKTVLVLEVEHDDSDIEIWGFVVDECTFIYSKHEVPFYFDPISNGRLMP